MCAGENYGNITDCVSGKTTCAIICKGYRYFVRGLADCPKGGGKRCWCFFGDRCNVVSNNNTKGFMVHHILNGVCYFERFNYLFVSISITNAF